MLYCRYKNVNGRGGQRGYSFAITTASLENFAIPLDPRKFPDGNREPSLLPLLHAYRLPNTSGRGFPPSLLFETPVRKFLVMKNSISNVTNVNIRTLTTYAPYKYICTSWAPFGKSRQHVAAPLLRDLRSCVRWPLPSSYRYGT